MTRKAMPLAMCCARIILVFNCVCAAGNCSSAYAMQVYTFSGHSTSMPTNFLYHPGGQLFLQDSNHASWHLLPRRKQWVLILAWCIRNGNWWQGVCIHLIHSWSHNHGPWSDALACMCIMQIPTLIQRRRLAATSATSRSYQSYHSGPPVPRPRHSRVPPSPQQTSAQLDQIKPPRLELVGIPAHSRPPHIVLRWCNAEKN